MRFFSLFITRPEDPQLQKKCVYTAVHLHKDVYINGNCNIAVTSILGYKKIVISRFENRVQA